MSIISHPQTVSTSPRPHVRSSAEALLDAAAQITSLLERGKAVGTADLRQIMNEAFGGSDAEGFWLWKDAYEATEAAQVLFLRKFGPAIMARTDARQSVLSMLTKVAKLVPTHSRRSTESQALQQLSTPLPLAYVAALAADMIAADVVLEPSAGTGLLAIFAELAHARLSLNEYASVRHSLLAQLFPRASISQHDAAHIDDYLDRTVRPAVVLMNPPFSAGVHVEGRVTDAAWRHLAAAFARLAPGGRLVAITGSGLSPDNRSWRDAFVRLQGEGTVLFGAAMDGGIYARHGTTTETRLTVIDKIPADDPAKVVASKGTAPDLETLLAWISGLPTRSPSPTSIGTLSDGTHRHDVGQLREKFDLVIFMGVLYHLRHPLLALDLLHEHVVADRMLFQCLQRGDERAPNLQENYEFSEWAVFDRPDYPKLFFVEERYASDPTNWFIPNKAAMEAMLRSSGFAIEANPEREVYLCRRGERHYMVEPPPRISPADP